jgi:hypothetical protein
MTNIKPQNCNIIYKNFISASRILVTESTKPRPNNVRPFTHPHLDDIFEANLWIHDNVIVKSKVQYSVGQIITDDRLNQLFGETL